MRVRVDCPEGHQFWCDDEHIGKTVRCPHDGCRARFVIQPVRPAEPLTERLPCAGCGQQMPIDTVVCTTGGTLCSDAPVDTLRSSINPAGSYHRLVSAQRAGESSVRNTDAGPSDAEVLDVLRSRTVHSGSIPRAIVMLVLSIAAFFVAGLFLIPPLYLAYLIPIILVHELGHLLAMIAFGYRDLRMLFVPFFGAFVSGRNARATGWQRAMVTLAGPAPSLLLGYFMLYLCSATQSSTWGVIALITIALNALNLIPVMPLDGGRFLNEVIFSRSTFFELAFRGVTTLMLVVLTVITRDWVLGILAGFGVLGFLGIPATLRSVNEARREIGDIPYAWSEQVPEAIAVIILRAVRRRAGVPERAEIMAIEVEHVWERLRTRPPGAVASLTLLLAYVALWISVFVVPLAFVYAMAMGKMPAPTTGYFAELLRGFADGWHGTTPSP